MYHGKYEAKKGTAAPRPKAPEKQKKKASPGSIAFYVLYFLLIVGFFLLLFGALNALEDWLMQYEASQPNVKCEQVFQELFEDPDWQQLYTLANEQDTVYDSADSYAAYMEQLVGANALTYSETSAGLSGDHKYVVKMGSEKIAVYTLTTDSAVTDQIKQWELGDIELFYERNASVTVCAQPDRTVTVNGTPLTDEHVVSLTTTLADGYLPSGVHGYQMQTQQLDGLLVAPKVAVTDAQGNPVEMVYDAAAQVYTEVLPQHQMADEKDTIVAAIEAYGKYMIQAVNQNQLARYFDSKEQAYKSIVRSDVSWTQNYQGYDFTEPQFSGFYRYSDKLFSVHVNMTMNVTRRDGSIKTFPVVGTFFFAKSGSKWMVTEMTNIDVQEQTTRVRLVWMQDGATVYTSMVESDTDALNTPPLQTPAGKVFSGWFRETVDDKGTTTMSLVFQPDETGKVTLPSDYTLEPMVLHALFENAS